MRTLSTALVLLLASVSAAVSQEHTSPRADVQLSLYKQVIVHAAGWYPAPKPPRVLLYALTMAHCDGYRCRGRGTTEDTWPRALVDSLTAAGIRVRVCERNGASCEGQNGEIEVSVGIPTIADRGPQVALGANVQWLRPKAGNVSRVDEAVDIALGAYCGTGLDTIPNCWPLTNTYRYYFSRDANGRLTPFAFERTSLSGPPLPAFTP